MPFDLGEDRRALRDLEEAQLFTQGVHLLRHLGGRAGQRLRRGGVALGHPVHLGHGPVHLGHAGRLLRRGGRHLLDQFGGLFHRGQHAIDERARALGRAHARARHGTDLPGRDLAALGQLAHLGSDHRKALALIAGPCGLDGGIESEQVGLIGDFLDDRDALGDGAHGLDGFGRGPAAAFGLGAQADRDLFAGAAVLRILRDRGVHLLEAGRRRFHRGGLLGRALRQDLRRRGDPAGACLEEVGARTHLAHHLTQLLGHPLHGEEQSAGLVARAASVYLDAQIPGRDCLGG